MLYKIVFGYQIHVLNGNHEQVITLQNLVRFIAHSFKNIPNNYSLSYFDSDGDLIYIINQQDLNVMMKRTAESVRIQIKMEDEGKGSQGGELASQMKKYYVENQINKMQIDNEDRKEKQMDKEKVKLQERQKKYPNQQKQNLQSMINNDRQICKLLTQFQQKGRVQQKKNQFYNELFAASAQSSSMKPEDNKIKFQHHQNIVIHENVRCDKCHKRPIQGIRYKCSICTNYDQCQKCQESTTHNHAFIKIRKPRIQFPKPHYFNSYPLSNQERKKIADQDYYTKLNNIRKQYKYEYKHQIKEIKKQMRSFKKKDQNDTQIHQNIKIANSAQYLNSIFQIGFGKSYQIVQENPQLTPEQLFQVCFQKQARK